MLSHLNIKYKLVLIIFITIIMPSIFMLYLIESGHIKEAKIYLSVELVCFIALIIPLSNLFAYFIVLKELREVNKFCLNIKEGQYDIFFDLPNENEDESEMIKIKRNMNWMLREIANRSVSMESKIIEIEEMKQEFQDLSINDSLTCLYNRRCFDCKIKEFAEKSVNLFTGFFLMFIDVDKFKQVNDTLGHQAGDNLLIKLGFIIKESTRQESDFPFRYGGDEFCVLISGSNLNIVTEVAERIRSKYEKSAIGGSTLSIGIAEFLSVHGSIDKNIEHLIKQADQAVYTSKHKGGNVVTVLTKNLSNDDTLLRNKNKTVQYKNRTS
ncbi:MAG: GGDEF domain-containing protein [Desulfamplus sp.]|nr:GGDEF domain-containing protein [Desulfamplus sp.]